MSWKRTKRFDSSEGNVFKYVFEQDDAIAEAVLYRYPTFAERTVVCCSTQSGCPVGCSFCGTGKRFIRNLSSAEIEDQVAFAFDDHGIDTRAVKKLQIMFMSMGEPMLNWLSVSSAVRSLSVRFPSADLLISTMAPTVRNYEYGDLVELSRKIPKVGLQFSIHESTDDARNKLIPFRSKLSLREIAFIGHAWSYETGRRPFFNYCAHEGNTAREDAQRLSALFWPDEWEATVSVVCEKNESIKASHERQRLLTSRFASLLLQEGFSVRMFDPAGQDDIGGGCGQLWFTQEWMRAHQRKGASSHQHQQTRN